MGCCGRKRRKKRTKKADALRFLYKIAKVKDDSKGPSNLVLGLDTGLLAGSGLAGYSVGKGVASDVQNFAQDRFINQTNAKVRRTLTNIGKNLRWRQLEAALNNRPIDPQHLQDMGRRAALRVQHIIDKKRGVLAKAEAGKPRGQRIGGALGALTLSLPAIHLLKKHLQQRRKAKMTVK